MGAAVLGMRGSGSFSVGGRYAQRPEDWRKAILRLYPNGHAPLTAILSMMNSEVATDAIFHWFQQALPGFRIFISNAGGYADDILELNVDDEDGSGMAQKCVRGSVVMVERTREILWVSQDPANEDTITVQRGMGEVAAAIIDDGDALYVFTTAYEQGADIPTPISFDPTHCENYCQIIRCSLAETRTAMRTDLRTGDAYEKAKLEALDMVSMYMENAFLFGQLRTAIQGGQLKLTTRGFYQWMIGNAACCGDGANVWAGVGDITAALFEGYIRQVCMYGSTNKLILCGGEFLQNLNEVYQGKVTINVVPGDQTYGLNLYHWITPFGEVYIKLHPLMTIHPVYTQDAMILDMSELTYRFIDDLDFITDRQGTGVDGRMDEFLVECGLEFHHHQAHGLIKGVTGNA